MAGSRKDVRLRLQRAALELYAERGFDRTTAADIAALAGVTERTYFRHFPDKREVLFDGEAGMRTALVDAVLNAPAGLPPIPTLLEAFLSVAPMFERDLAVKALRHRIVSSTPELQERELMKLAHLTDALTEALEQRAAPPGLASLAAACGTAVLTRARLQWLAGSQADYATLLTDAFAELGLLVTARDELQWIGRARLGGGMEKVDYDARLHAVYAAGRQMSPDALRTWMAAFARHLPQTRPLAWLDLGSGTGRMTPSLASAFGGPAHGVEPSGKMRAQAVAHAGHPAVTYAAGSAEHIPLPDASCDAALLFFAWHHVADREGAAQELRRVVKPGGRLFVQANFSDRMPDVWWFRVVPEWRKADTAQFRSEEEVKRDFAGAGWTFVSRDEVTWLRSASLAEDFERLKLRAVSLFELMTEEVAEAGFARIEAALPSLGDGPQYETSELLVFQR